MLILGLKGLNNTKKCSSRKHPYSLCRGERKFQGGWGGGVSKAQKFKAMYEAKLEFPAGRA